MLGRRDVQERVAAFDIDHRPARRVSDRRRALSDVLVAGDGIAVSGALQIRAELVDRDDVDEAPLQDQRQRVETGLAVSHLVLSFSRCRTMSEHWRGSAGKFFVEAKGCWTIAGAHPIDAVQWVFTQIPGWRT